tara:strand:- start:522 stop:1970 length:1449 start_codon:yes stop_codon:yes gene_type:complete
MDISSDQSDKNFELDFISRQVLSSNIDIWKYIEYLKETSDYELFEWYYNQNIKNRNFKENDIEILNENNTIILLKKIISYEDSVHEDYNFTLFSINLEKDEPIDVCVYYKREEGDDTVYLHLVSIENKKNEEYIVDNRSFILYSIIKKIKELEEVETVFLNEVLFEPVSYDESNVVDFDIYLEKEQLRIKEKNEMFEQFQKLALEKEEEMRQLLAQELIDEEEKEKEKEKDQSNKKSPRKKHKKPKERKNPKVSESQTVELEASSSHFSDTLQTQSIPVDEQDEKEFWNTYLQIEEDREIAERLNRSPDTVRTEKSEDDSNLNVNELLMSMSTELEEPREEEKIDQLLEHIKDDPAHIQDSIKNIGGPSEETLFQQLELEKDKKKKKPLPSFLPEYESEENEETIKKLNYLVSKNVLDIETIPLEYDGQTFYFRVVKNSHIYTKLKSIKTESALKSLVNELFNLPEEEYKFLSIFGKTTPQA